MIEADKKQFGQIVRSTMLVCGGSAPDADVLRIWWASLVSHDIQEVSYAFSDYAKKGRYPPKPADILEVLDKIKPDGRPTADEAWAMIPRSEEASAVMTNEMAEALHIAQPLLDESDQIAARIAFKDAYGRIVDTAKRSGVMPTWFPSLGNDKDGRESVLAEAVRLGRLKADHAIGLLPPEKIAPMLQSAGKETLALEYKLPGPEETLARIQGLKAIMQKVQK